MLVSEVVQAFLRREPGWSKTVTSTGQELLSYGTRIAFWDGARGVNVSNPWVSRTTSRHVGMVVAMASAASIPYLLTEATPPRGRKEV